MPEQVVKRASALFRAGLENLSSISIHNTGAEPDLELDGFNELETCCNTLRPPTLRSSTSLSMSSSSTITLAEGQDDESSPGFASTKTEPQSEEEEEEKTKPPSGLAGFWSSNISVDVPGSAARDHLGELPYNCCGFDKYTPHIHISV